MKSNEHWIIKMPAEIWIRKIYVLMAFVLFCFILMICWFYGIGKDTGYNLGWQQGYHEASARVVTLEPTPVYKRSRDDADDTPFDYTGTYCEVCGKALGKDDGMNIYLINGKINKYWNLIMCGSYICYYHFKKLFPEYQGHVKDRMIEIDVNQVPDEELKKYLLSLEYSFKTGESLLYKKGYLSGEE